MFADVSGSSTLYKLLGNEVAKAKIDVTLATMIAETERHEGCLVKTIGDEIMVTFRSVEQACLCAQQLQRYSGLNYAQLPLRIGMSFGETLLDNEDVFGDVVNNAAWLTQTARAGQILISESMYLNLPFEMQMDCHEFDRVAFKGDDEKSVIYRVHWESLTQAHNATAVLTIDDITQTCDVVSITLEYGNHRHCILPQQTPFVLGRDSNRANLRINHHLASREHCEVVFRRGKFVLIDHSTNGTYVSGHNQEEIYLRREELPLVGEGKISIGQSISSDKGNEQIVCFSTSRTASELDSQTA
jgi:adenylate cyclase